MDSTPDSPEADGPPAGAAVLLHATDGETPAHPSASTIDYERLAAELLRVLRGRRTQSAFSQRLGYRSNVVRTWEAQRRFPTAARSFAAAQFAGMAPARVLGQFLAGSPAWAETLDLCSADGISRLLRELRGGQKIQDIARRTGRSRYAVSRWLEGEAEPRLPDFLRMIEGCTLRVLDFVACLLDPARLPSVSAHWQALQRAREVALARPWSHAVLRVIELESYRALPAHKPGFIAQQLGISHEEEASCLQLLRDSGQIERHDGRYVPARVLTVDTRNPQTGRTLVRFWAETGVERLSQGSAGLFSYNLFTVSEADYARLRELHLAYFRQLRAIVAQSEPAQRVVVANVQLFGLDE